MIYEEHSQVRLKHQAGQFNEYEIGKVGTVVHVFPHGLAYLVEFTYDGPAGDGAYGDVVAIDAEWLEADS